MKESARNKACFRASGILRSCVDSTHRNYAVREVVMTVFLFVALMSMLRVGFSSDIEETSVYRGMCLLSINR